MVISDKAGLGRQGSLSSLTLASTIFSKRDSHFHDEVMSAGKLGGVGNTRAKRDPNWRQASDSSFLNFDVLI